MDSGRSLSDIKNDTSIGTYASVSLLLQTFPGLKRTVVIIRLTGMVATRLLATRELGYDIPIRVVVIRHYKIVSGD